MVMIYLIVTTCLLGLFSLARAESIPPHLLPVDAVKDANQVEDSTRPDSPRDFPFWVYSASLALADLDGDQYDEMIVLVWESVWESDHTVAEKHDFHSGILARRETGFRYVARFTGHANNYFPRLLDFNGDGIQDLMYETSAGGNMLENYWDRVVWWDGEEYQQQDIKHFKDAYDFDQDGILELETTIDADFLWDRAIQCKVSLATLRELQYTPSTILRWDGQRLVDVSAECPEFYRLVRVPKLEEEIRLMEEKLKDECSSARLKEFLQCWIPLYETLLERARKLGGMS